MLCCKYRKWLHNKNSTHTMHWPYLLRLGYKVTKHNFHISLPPPFCLSLNYFRPILHFFSSFCFTNSPWIGNLFFFQCFPLCILCQWQRSTTFLKLLVELFPCHLCALLFSCFVCSSFQFTGSFFCCWVKLILLVAIPKIFAISKLLSMKFAAFTWNSLDRLEIWLWW